MSKRWDLQYEKKTKEEREKWIQSVVERVQKARETGELQVINGKIQIKIV